MDGVEIVSTEIDRNVLRQVKSFAQKIMIGKYHLQTKDKPRKLHQLQPGSPWRKRTSHHFFFSHQERKNMEEFPTPHRDLLLVGSLIHRRLSFFQETSWSSSCSYPRTGSNFSTFEAMKRNERRRPYFPWVQKRWHKNVEHVSGRKLRSRLLGQIGAEFARKMCTVFTTEQMCLGGHFFWQVCPGWYAVIQNFFLFCFSVGTMVSEKP